LLTPGTKLSPERELAANFGVARSSFRPALKVLEIMGVITQKVGDGSYLNRDAYSVLAVPMEFLFLLDDTSLQELTEMRLMMEPALAAKAAERAPMRSTSHCSGSPSSTWNTANATVFASSPPIYSSTVPSFRLQATA
jgi:DNA-binding FadR family transcriptional regulator